MTVTIVAIAAVAAAGIIATLAFLYPSPESSTTLEGLEREQRGETIPGDQSADQNGGQQTPSYP